MAKGTWGTDNKPEIPGFYNRFQTAAEATIANGTTGTLALTVTANWGSIKEPVLINNDVENTLKATFGTDDNYTAYKLGKLALLGKPKELLIYRLADSSASKASLVLQTTDSSPLNAITLETLYPTTRDFKVTVKTNVADSDKKNIILYEGSKQLFNITVSGTFAEIAKTINNATANTYITAKTSEVSSTTNTLDNVATKNFTGGNDGTAGITNQDYIDAMTIFEGYEKDAFVIDRYADSALQAAIQTWNTQCKENGDIFLIFVTGVNNSETLDDANQRSNDYNDYLVNNLYLGTATYNGTTYNSAEVLVYIAALAIGKGLKESISNETTIFDSVTPKLSKTQITSAIKNGTIVLYEDGGRVVVADDVNTYKTYKDEAGKAFGTIQTVIFLKTVNEDTSAKRFEISGKADGNDTGRTIALSSLKKYFETLNNNGIIADDFVVKIDEEKQATAEADEMYWIWQVTHYKKLKRVYGTGIIAE